MKKILFLFGLLAVIAFACNPHGANAQERSVSITVPAGNTYMKYAGTTSDVLIPTTRDTIDLIFWFRVDQYVQKVAVKTRFDMRTTADTTVAVTVAGIEFKDHTSYTDVIASTTSSAVTANNTVQVLVSDPYSVEALYKYEVTGGDSTLTAHNHTPFDKSYRYYRIRYILQGDDSVGTGINIDEVEIKLYTY